VTAPEPLAGSLEGRLAAVRRLEATALGSRALQRLTGLAVRLLGADAASVSLLGDVETVVGGDGLAAGTLGRQVPLDESLCAVVLDHLPTPLVVPDARQEPGLAGLPGGPAAAARGGAGEGPGPLRPAVAVSRGAAAPRRA
jgi:hypothetical protein